MDKVKWLSWYLLRGEVGEVFGLSLDYLRERFFTMMQQAVESTTAFVICVEQEYLCIGVGVTTS